MTGPDPDVERDLTPGADLHPPAITDTHLVEDPHYVPAWTKALESVEEQALGLVSRPFRRAGAEPHASEFSYGRGRTAPLDKADPSLWEQMRAIYRTDSTDPAAVVNYDGEVREASGPPSIRE